MGWLVGSRLCSHLLPLFTPYFRPGLHALGYRLALVLARPRLHRQARSRRQPSLFHRRPLPPVERHVPGEDVEQGRSQHIRRRRPPRRAAQAQLGVRVSVHAQAPNTPSRHAALPYLALVPLANPRLPQLRARGVLVLGTVHVDQRVARPLHVAAAHRPERAAVRRGRVDVGQGSHQVRSAEWRCERKASFSERELSTSPSPFVHTCAWLTHVYQHHRPTVLYLRLLPPYHRFHARRAPLVPRDAFLQSGRRNAFREGIPRSLVQLRSHPLPHGHVEDRQDVPLCRRR